MRKLFNQSGGIHLLSLLVMLSAIGTIAYLLISSTAPTKGGIFQALNPKPHSQAAASFTCTMFIGYSQTNNWFGDFLGDISNSRNYEELIQFGGAARYWVDPN